MSDPGGSNWTLLTGHGHVLVEIARDPEARIRDISAAVDLTERTVQAIVADLEAAGYLTRTRNGRRTKYSVNRDSLFRHSAQEGLRVGPLLDLLATQSAPGAENRTAVGDEATGGEGPQAPTTPGHRPMLRRRRR
jgi:MarR family